MKTSVAVAAAVALLPLSASAASYLIVPGHSIGRTHLGPDGNASLKRLPCPDGSDAGMQQQRLVWTSKTAGRAPETLYIHTTANAALAVKPVKPVDGVTIDDIRVTSPSFHARGGIHPGSTLAAVRRRYPRARPVVGDKAIYDDVRQGIAFEFAPGSSRCTAISVHPSGDSHVEGADVVNNVLKEGAGG